MHSEEGAHQMSHAFLACPEESPYCGNLCHHRDEAGKFDCWVASQNHEAPEEP